MSNSTAVATKKHRAIDRLSAIKLHANALRRRLRRKEGLDPVDAESRLRAIDHEVDAAAALVRQLADDDTGEG